jgi:hypothetical protein
MAEPPETALESNQASIHTATATTTSVHLGPKSPYLRKQEAFSVLKEPSEPSSIVTQFSHDDEMATSCFANGILHRYIAIRAPDPLQENLLWNVHNWLEVGFDTRKWLVDQRRCLVGFSNNDLMDAVVFFQEGCSEIQEHRGKVPFRLFNLAFDRLNSSIKAESPDLVIKILRRIFLARQAIGFVGLELSQMLLHHLVGLSTVVHGSNHPLVAIWGNLERALNGDTWAHHIEAIARLYKHVMVRRSASYEQFVLDAVNIHSNFDANVNLEDELEMLLASAQNERRDDMSCEIDKGILRIKLELALALIQTEPMRSDEARMLLAEILSDPFAAAHEKARARRRLFVLEERLGDYGAAEWQMREAIRLLDQSLGKTYRGSLKYLRLLAGFLERVYGTAVASNCLVEIERRINIHENSGRLLSKYAKPI